MGNGTEMGIVFNKRGGVGMRVIRPEPTPLSFLDRCESRLSILHTQ